MGQILLLPVVVLSLHTRKLCTVVLCAIVLWPMSRPNVLQSVQAAGLLAVRSMPYPRRMRLPVLRFRRVLVLGVLCSGFLWEHLVLQRPAGTTPERPAVLLSVSELWLCSCIGCARGDSTTGG